MMFKASNLRLVRVCLILDNKISDLKASGNVNEPLYNRYSMYHDALIHKIRSAREYKESISSYLSSANTQTDSSDEMLYRVNHCFDGFCHNIGSVLDIFAREILTFYGRQLPDYVYFHTVRTLIRENNPSDNILPLLAEPSWKEEFIRYRNAITHENLAVNSYSQKKYKQGKKWTERFIFELPNDPTMVFTEREYTNNPDVEEYIEKIIVGTVDMIAAVYSHICNRIDSNNQLPI